MRSFRIAAFAAVLVVSVIHPVSAQAAAKWFHSASGNIQCEVASNDSRGSYAYCQTFEPPRSVKLTTNGKYTVCKGATCVGDGPTDAFTLKRGESTNVGQFRCTARTNGMRCVVVKSGRGFLIGRAGVTTVR